MWFDHTVDDASDAHLFEQTMQHWYIIYTFDVALSAAYVYHTDRVYQISLYMLNLNERRVLTIRLMKSIHFPLVVLDMNTNVGSITPQMR